MAVLAILIFASQCDGSGTQDASVDETKAAAELAIDKAMDAEADALAAAGDDSASTAKHNWNYSVSRDEARGKDVKTASLVSENEVYLDSPYGGGTKATLYIRQHPSYGLDVYIHARPSQLLCNSYDGCRGLINFDGKPETFSLIGPSDNDSELVFAKFGSAIKNKLLKADKVIVELPFYSNGNRQFTFNTSGLEWPIKE